MVCGRRRSRRSAALPTSWPGTPSAHSAWRWTRCAPRTTRRRADASDAPVPTRLAGPGQLDRGPDAGVLRAADRATARATRSRRRRLLADEQPPRGYGAAGALAAASHLLRGLRGAWPRGRPDTIWGGAASLLAHRGRWPTISPCAAAPTPRRRAAKPSGPFNWAPSWRSLCTDARTWAGGGGWGGWGGGATLQSRKIRLQIADRRFQISDPDTRREISAGDFRFQSADRRRHNSRNLEEKQNSKRAEHISRLHRRFLRHPDFRFQIPKLARSLISDFRLRFSDPRTPAAPRQRFQISENRFQRSRARSHRFQISDFRSLRGAGQNVASPLQISDLRIQTPECHTDWRVCQKSRCQISECIIQIPGAKKYRLEGPGDTGTRAGPNGAIGWITGRIDPRVGPLHRETAWLGVGLRAD